MEGSNVNETEIIHIRYWAAARAAAGVSGDLIRSADPLTLADLRSRAIALHPGSGLAEVLAVCSVLVGDQPVSTVDPATVLVSPGTSVEFLPPFAGG